MRTKKSRTPTWTKEFERHLLRTLDKHWKQPAPDAKLGRFILKERLGSGNFAVVWRALDTETERTRAVKIFCPLQFDERAVQEEALARFVNGVENMGKLAGDSTIVAVDDKVECSGPYVFFSMDFYGEGDLDRRISRADLTEQEKINIINDIITALTHAHSKNIRHRDVKPKNILLTRDESGALRGVLADFDISYHESRLQQHRTTEFAWGSRKYIPPEIFAAEGEALKELMRRFTNDLYATCVVIFDLFSGTKGIPNERREDEILKLFEDANEEPYAVHPGIIKRASKLCARGISLSAEKRFRTIANLDNHWNPHGRAKIFIHKIAFGVSLGLLVLTGCVLVDYFWHYMWDHAKAAVGLAVTVLVALGLLTGVRGRVVTLYEKYWARHANDNYSKWLNSLAPLVTLSALMATYYLSNLQSRVDSVRIVNGEGCELKTRDTDRKIHDDSSRLMSVTKGSIIECPHRKQGKVTVDPLSFFHRKVAIHFKEVLVAKKESKQKQITSPLNESEPRIVPLRPLSEYDIRRKIRRTRAKKPLLWELDELERKLPSKKYGDIERFHVRIPMELRVEINNILKRVDELPERVIGKRSHGRYPAFFATQAHLGILLFDCQLGMQKYKTSLTTSSWRIRKPQLLQVWMADSIRCLSDRDGYLHVREFVETSIPHGTEKRNRKLLESDKYPLYIQIYFGL